MGARGAECTRSASAVRGARAVAVSSAHRHLMLHPIDGR